MKWSEKIRFVLFVWRLRNKLQLNTIKRRIWNKHILLWWYRLWIRKDEFHQSLNIDSMAMLTMNKKEKKQYLADLVRRREVAHQRYLNKTE